MRAPVFKAGSIRSVLVFVLSTAGCLLTVQAQASSNTAENAAGVPTIKAKALPPELARIVDASRQVPPEFHAYALLLVVESGRVEDKAATLELLQEALETAQLATEPFNKMLALNGVVVESDVGTWMFKRRFALDRTSLLARAMTDAEKLDPAAARTMLEDARWPIVEPSACTNALADDPEAYYKLLTLLAHNRAANLKDGKDATSQLLEPAVGNLKAHRQIELALRLVNEAELTPEQRGILMRRLAGQLGQIHDDDRGFAATLLDRSYNGWIQELKRSFDRLDESTARAFLREFRGYLVENLKAGGCGADWLRRHDAAGQALLPRAVVAFNEQLSTQLEQSGLEPVSLAEIDSHAPVVVAEFKTYGQSEEAKALMAAAKALRFDAKNQRRTLDELNSMAWTQQATMFLGKVDDWPVDPFNSADAFWMKMEFYTGVIDLAPQADLRWLALEKAIVQLENSRLETEDPALLMVFTFQLHIRATSQMNGEERQTRSAHDLARRLAGERSPTLRLLGLLEEQKLKPIPDSF
jgi:hypothetical protein